MNDSNPLSRSQPRIVAGLCDRNQRNFFSVAGQLSAVAMRWPAETFDAGDPLADGAT
jgi:hypothetical protein